jgi:hypothetical protein
MDKTMQAYWKRREKDPPLPKFTLQDWLDYCANRRRQEQEVMDSRNFGASVVPMPVVAEQIPADQTPIKKPQSQETWDTTKREITTRIKTQLAKEVGATEVALMARDIQEHIWRDNSVRSNERISSILPAIAGDILIKDDGQIINRNRVGVSLSYRKDGRHPINPWEGQYTMLSMGIGYFGRRGEIVPEAQGLVSDEDLKKGIKGYFVERMLVDRKTGKEVKEVVVIPLVLQDSLYTFFKHLYDSAVDMAPEKRLPARVAERFRRTPIAA